MATIHQDCTKVNRNLFNLVEFSSRLRAERKTKGLNQTEFGRLGGVGLQTQSRYEKAETEPGAEYFANLAGAGVDVHFVLTGRRARELFSESQTELIDLIALLDDADQSAILHLTRSLAQRAPASARLHTPNAEFRGERD
ncbi:transcriptional regulator with XRE-family HTH domain [Sphingomonas kyeonggiensis]|uniref:helix-turn-helix domain-containing protein n=1 Tax=Sphingomonas kyeonggiensis TaxID=1268553 RepID=UPI00277FE1A4|nr:helix-turn-helix transcriptional regulator [Sphingomonas kyeonggiensis]MDQ0250943.1 transcriptional regulator with XRE-family HTH domain [Sphingomonas kyeonggiensis]